MTWSRGARTLPLTLSPRCLFRVYAKCIWLDEEDGLAKLRNEVAIALVNVKETVEDIHDTIRFLWERISHLADES